MRAYGQPAHVFDFDAISDKDNHATMILRSSRKGEKLVTLDGKSHILPGGDIVIEDGKGNLIDLCGIMGAQNSAIASTTKTVILFLQTYDPIGIRRTMMSLGHRTEAGGLFEKGTDPELVMPACTKGVELIQELSGGRVASRLYDYYPKPYSSAEVSVSRTKSDAYIGKHLTDKEIGDMLTPMGFEAHLTKDVIRVTVPSFRRDVAIDVDIIEELARIYGYHNITSTLPDTPPPVSVPDPALSWEEEIKVRLRDWGYTETYTYSMISEELMDIFGLDTSNAYKIANPLSNEWVYMRPQLTPSVLASLSQNIHIKNDLKLFELSMVYVFRANDLPIEIPTLVIAWTGNKFYEAKGVAEAIFDLMGIEFPSGNHKRAKSLAMNSSIYLHVGDYGSIEGINPYILSRMNIDTPVTRLFLDFSKLIKHAKTIKNYTPIPKYPPSFEDLAFNVKPKTLVGDMIASLKTVDPLISDISLLDSFGDTRTLHITYLSLEGNLVSEDIKRVREKILSKALKDFEAVLKS
jgi:phenylalanyl-tRNA synthetase beta chain